MGKSEKDWTQLIILVKINVKILIKVKYFFFSKLLWYKETNNGKSEKRLNTIHNTHQNNNKLQFLCVFFFF